MSSGGKASVRCVTGRIGLGRAAHAIKRTVTPGKLMARSRRIGSSQSWLRRCGRSGLIALGARRYGRAARCARSRANDMAKWQKVIQQADHGRMSIVSRFCSIAGRRLAL
jgi:hypothetical protein